MELTREVRLGSEDVGVYNLPIKPDHATRLVVAGTRSYNDEVVFNKTLWHLLNNLGWSKGSASQNLTILQGKAKGPDQMALAFCQQHDIRCESYPAEWDNVAAPDAIIKTNGQGKQYNARAGFQRNEKMAKNATHLVAFWDGKSPGTKQMIETAKEHMLYVLVVRVDAPF